MSIGSKCESSRIDKQELYLLVCGSTACKRHQEATFRHGTTRRRWNTFISSRLSKNVRWGRMSMGSKCELSRFDLQEVQLCVCRSTARKRQQEATFRHGTNRWYWNTFISNKLSKHARWGRMSMGSKCELSRIDKHELYLLVCGSTARKRYQRQLSVTGPTDGTETHSS